MDSDIGIARNYLLIIALLVMDILNINYTKIININALDYIDLKELHSSQILKINRK